MAHSIRDLLTQPQQELYDLLVELQQEHLFQNWSPSDDASRRDAFFDQIAQLDESYPGGLRQYVATAGRLLEQSKNEESRLKGFKPHVPDCVRLNVPDADFLACERLGMRHIGDAAFVLVAGGLGERLGYDGIKVALPIETTSGKSFLQYYIEYILAFQTRARRLRGDDHWTLPLMVMTSDQTHTLTEGFLKQANFFGMEPDQVTLVKQDNVPSLADGDAHFVPIENNPYQIQTKPHGHGDVHLLLHRTGLAERWLEQGKRWVVFFQDTNGLSFRGFAAALGASVRESYEVNSIAVPRKAGEAIGANTRLTHEDGREKTVSIEYNELSALLKATGHTQGDAPDETGWSPFPGNVNLLVFALERYAYVLQKTGGVVPEFVNPKYADASRERFLAPTRVECLMQDYAWLLPNTANVGVTQIDRWLVFSPVKNSLEKARTLHAKGIPIETAGSGEMDIYGCVAKILQSAPGNDIAKCEEGQFEGLPLPVGPRIVLSPAFATTVAEIQDKIRRLKIGRGSTLWIEGEDVEIDDLELDGTLVIRAAPGTLLRLNGIRIQNGGWPIRALDADGTHQKADEIRGFIIEHDGAYSLVTASAPPRDPGGAA